MAAEEFFRRWSKPQPALPDEHAKAAPLPPQSPGAPAEPRLPTAADVATLGLDSDFAPFLAQGVDEAVKRSALKKLFSDPRFNLMDGLDTYIDDYSKFEPLPAQLLAALNHAKSLLNPLGLPENDQPPAADEPGSELPEAAARLAQAPESPAHGAPDAE